MGKNRIITSYSDVITNSSTELFLIQGPDALRQMIGSGVYKKYQKDFLVLRTEEEIEYFFRFDGKRGFNHNYSKYNLKPLLGDLLELYTGMSYEFPEKEEDIWEIVKPKIMERLKGTIAYIDIKNNNKILKRLYELYPNNNHTYYPPCENPTSLEYLKEHKYRYYWGLD